MATESTTPTGSRASRYELLLKLASGGMATVYVGCLRSAAGFWRVVAIKRAHAHLLEDAAFKQMFIEEARLASRIHHANVVSVLDVEEQRGELCLILDYIEGASLGELLASTERPLPARLAVRIVLDACAGLHAAHELADDHGRPVGIVHRDVSPQNILVGIDGTSRLSDFGIAKVDGGGPHTTTGTLKGKIGYMAPEYVRDSRLDARSDIFSMGVVAWEALARRKLFRGSNEMIETLQQIVGMAAPPLSAVAPWLGKRLDSVIAAALEKEPENRFQTAKALALALETAARRGDLVGSHEEVAAHVRSLFGESLERRRALVSDRMAARRDDGSGDVHTSPLTRPVRDGQESGGLPAEIAARTPATSSDSRRDGPSTFAAGENSSLAGNTSSRPDDSAVAPKPRWPSGLAVAAAGVLGGVVIAMVANRARIWHEAQVTVVAAAASGAIAAPPPLVTPEPSAVPTTSASASVPVLASARPPRLSGRATPAASARPAPVKTADPGPLIPPNPYAR